MNYRRIFVVVVILMTSLIFTGCASHYAIHPETLRFTPAPNGEVKVMTFNIRVDTMLDGFNGWGRRKQLVVDTLQANAADVVGLQEAESDQLRVIRQAMPQYNQYAIGRNDGVAKGETCAIFYRKDRFVLQDSGTFWFSNTPSVPGSKDWGNLWPRICSWVHLIDKTTHSGFYVYNVHMDNLSQNSRKLSTQLLTGQIAARKIKDPFIIMGDFNMEADNPAMKSLQQVAYKSAYPGTIDAWSSVHFREPLVGTRHGFHGGDSGPMIDHIRLCQNIVPLEARVDQRSFNGRYPSDHFPVTAKLLFKNSPQVVSYAEQESTESKAVLKKPI